jgi:hypothetical protein
MTSAPLTETVLAALGVEPDAIEVAPRGLIRVESNDRGRLCGTRAGRQVEIRFTAGTMVTWVRASTHDIQALGNNAGTFVVDAGAPPVGAAALAGLAELVGANEVWRDVRVRGGAEGLVAFRRTGAWGYLYDLWLLELLADALDAVALAPVDLNAETPPYRVC